MGSNIDVTVPAQDNASTANVRQNFQAAKDEIEALQTGKADLSHVTRHQNGGADEINVAGLSGELADPQPAKTHATSHQNGGGDEINVAGLSGELADDQPPKAHAADHVGAGDEIDGDKLDIDFTPTNYTPDASPAEADDADDLTAHLKGLDVVAHAHGIANSQKMADMYSAITGTWVYSITTSQAYCFAFYNSSDAQNDEISFKIFAEAGNKTLEILCVTSGGYAIATVYLDDVEQGTIDLYSSSTKYNKKKTLAVTVVGTGEHTIRFKAATRNGSSTGWILALTWLRIY